MVEHVFTKLCKRRQTCVVAGVLYLHAANGVSAYNRFTKRNFLADAADEARGESVARAGGVDYLVSRKCRSGSAFDRALVERTLLSKLDYHLSGAARDVVVRDLLRTG